VIIFWVAHIGQHHIAPSLGGRGVGDRVVGGRVLNHPSQQRGLRQRQFRGRDREVAHRCSLDAVGLLVEVDDVQVALEDLLFGQLLFHRGGQA
jgi:hypothetical protein